MFLVQKHNIPECQAPQHYVEGVVAICIMHVHVARDVSKTHFTMMVSHLGLAAKLLACGCSCHSQKFKYLCHVSYFNMPHMCHKTP